MNQEEKRFWAAALILAGISANYHHVFIPSDYWASGAVHLADYLLKVLSDPQKYQNNGKGEKYQNNLGKHF